MQLCVSSCLFSKDLLNIDLLEIFGSYKIFVVCRFLRPSRKVPELDIQEFSLNVPVKYSRLVAIDILLNCFVYFMSPMGVHIAFSDAA